MGRISGLWFVISDFLYCRIFYGNPYIPHTGSPDNPENINILTAAVISTAAFYFYLYLHEISLDKMKNRTDHIPPTYIYELCSFCRGGFIVEFFQGTFSYRITPSVSFSIIFLSYFSFVFSLLFLMYIIFKIFTSSS